MINIDNLKGEYRDPRLDSAVTIALRHIGIAVYSSGKIYDYLIRKGFESDIAHTAVQELIERNYIDDMRAGRKVLLSRTGRKQESRSLLYKRLLQAGINEEQANELIHQTRDDKTTCLELVKSTVPVIPDDVLQDNADFFVQDLLKLCARRGYSLDISRESIRQYINEN